MYWQAITVIEAREAIMALKIADYPWLKKESRQAIYHELYRQAFPPKRSLLTKPVTMEQFAKKLGARIHGK